MSRVIGLRELPDGRAWVCRACLTADVPPPRREGADHPDTAPQPRQAVSVDLSPVSDPVLFDPATLRRTVTATDPPADPTDPYGPPHPDLAPDDADTLMAAWTDTAEALDALETAALGVSCPCCDPSGAATERVRRTLGARYGLDELTARLFLDRCADVRAALLTVLAEPCEHHGGAA